MGSFQGSRKGYSRKGQKANPKEQEAGLRRKLKNDITRRGRKRGWEEENESKSCWSWGERVETDVVEKTEEKALINLLMRLVRPESLELSRAKGPGPPGPSVSIDCSSPGPAIDREAITACTSDPSL